MDGWFFRTLITKSLVPTNTDDRFFEGILTVQMKDKQGEITITDELMKVLPIWMDRGAPITDTHSNRVVGKGINFARIEIKGEDNEMLPAIKITGKIHKNYELDNDIWEKITTGEYKGLSFGGATKADRQPVRMKDGSIAYTLGDLEHYEVAVCADPAVPLALITDYNPLAKASTMAEDLGNGKMLIKCDKYGCYVDKDADLTEEDTFDGKVQKLIADGKSKEQAEKIVGSFVKGDQGREGNSDAETDGNNHSMYNQDVDPDTSSGRNNVAIKEQWEGNGSPQPKKIEEEKTKDGSVQGGLRGLGGYNTSQQGADDIAQISEVKEAKHIKEENYIKNEKQDSDSNMADENFKKPEEEVKAEEKIEDEPKVEKTEEDVEDKNKAFDAISEQLKAIINGQKSLGERIKALETPTDLPLTPKVSDKDDIGAEVKVPDTYQSNSVQAGLDDDKSGEKKPEGDKGLAMQEKSLVNKSSHTFTTETPRPNAALETLEKSSGKDYSPILKDARAAGFEGLSQVAQNILAGKYYRPTSDEVGTY
jgi:hypothetical protein